MNQKFSNTSSHDIVSSIWKNVSKFVILVFIARDIWKQHQVANQFKEIIPRILSLMHTIEYHGRIRVILGDGNQSVAMGYFTQQMQKKNSTMVMFHLKVRSQLEQFHTRDRLPTWAVDQNVPFGHLTISQNGFGGILTCGRFQLTSEKELFKNILSSIDQNFQKMQNHSEI